MYSWSGACVSLASAAAALIVVARACVSCTGIGPHTSAVHLDLQLEVAPVPCSVSALSRAAPFSQQDLVLSVLVESLEDSHTCMAGWADTKQSEHSAVLLA